MRRIFYSVLLLSLFAGGTSYGQNADQLFYNQVLIEHDYEAASFVVDTAGPAYRYKRAFLLWSKNYQPASANRFLSLDEFDANGNFLTEHVNRHNKVPTSSLIPKKIIKSQHFKGYYLLGYVIKSNNPVDTFNVYSTPVVIQLDDNLTPVWTIKLHHAALSPNNINTLIEYNDIVEAKNGEIILAGRYSAYYTGQQTRVLITRLKSSGSIIWNYQYFNSPRCNAEALSLSEATDGNIVLTGYMENCISPGITGTRQLLYMSVTATGAPILSQKLTSRGTLVGDKITRHTSSPGSDEFFISGYIDVPDVTGAPNNRQVLVVDLKQSGGIISAHHLGDVGAEVANDLIFQSPGGNDYYLYLTGYTSSYDNTVKAEVYFLQLKYSGGSMALAEFHTFPRPSTEYGARIGVEIKKAGKERYAILASAVYNVGTQNRTYTSVLIRDLAARQVNCTKEYVPPLKRIDLATVLFSSDNINLNFKEYKEEYKEFEKIYVKPQCDSFFIDAPNAVTIAGNPDQVDKVNASRLVKTNTTPKQPVTVTRVFPNPANAQVYIDYAGVLNEPVVVKVYSNTMQLIKEHKLTGQSRMTIPLTGLTNGLYFIQVDDKTGKQVFKIRKE